MNLDAFYQALSSLAQGINNLGSKFASVINSSNQVSVSSTTVISSIPALDINDTPASFYPPNATALSASSGNVAATNATATLTATASVTNWLEGFDITSAGATSATNASVTVTGLVGGTLTYAYSTIAGVTTANSIMSIRFPRPKSATTNDSAVSVTLSSLGSGNTNASVVVYGYRV